MNQVPKLAKSNGTVFKPVAALTKACGGPRLPSLPYLATFQASGTGVTYALIYT